MPDEAKKQSIKMQRKKVIPSMNYSDPKMKYLNRCFEEESSMLNAFQKYALTFIFKIFFFSI